LGILSTLKYQLEYQMKLSNSPLPGVFVIDIEPIKDDRGMFARCWCKDEFEQQGLRTELSQCSISFNQSKATLRGMHYQLTPHEEIKIVRCTRGSIFDVVIDLRPESTTFKQWFGTSLSAENHRMLYIPEGLAHGFVTLEPQTEVFYQISVPYEPGSARGVRWNDSCFNINWPIEPTVISSKDLNYPNFSDIIGS
jgi:dTDP-4-dehydrorhamnose 3,5-epimerase